MSEKLLSQALKLDSSRLLPSLPDAFCVAEIPRSLFGFLSIILTKTMRHVLNAVLQWDHIGKRITNLRLYRAKAHPDVVAHAVPPYRDQHAFELWIPQGLFFEMGDH